MIITWCSAKGAPGVSAWSVFTAGLWPIEAGDVVVLEADLSGGVMATRYGIGVSPGAIDLAVRSLRSPDELKLEDVARRVGEHGWMVPGPSIPSQADSGWRGQIDSCARWLAEDSRVWFVDVGRFSNRSWPWVERSIMTVVLSWGAVDSLVSSEPVISEIRAASPVRAVIVGKPAHPLAEVASFFECEVRTVPSAVPVAESRLVWDGPRRWRRGAMWSAGIELAVELADVTNLVTRP